MAVGESSLVPLIEAANAARVVSVRERVVTLPTRGLRPRWLYPAIASALIGAFLLQTLLSMREMSARYDEPVYLATGYSYWKTRDHRMNFEHPPLIKLLVAIPLSLSALRFPPMIRSCRDPNEYAFGAAFMHRDLRIVEQILFRSRLTVVFIGVLLAVFVRRWASELWGPQAGLAARFMFVFDPNIPAQSRPATLGLGFAAFTFLSMYYAWKWLRTRRPGDAVRASVTLGLTLLSKRTALALLPIFLTEIILSQGAASRSHVLSHVRLVKGLLQLLVGGVIVVVVVYAAAFRWHPPPTRAGSIGP
jgi:hypothetical protein